MRRRQVVARRAVHLLEQRRGLRQVALQQGDPRPPAVRRRSQLSVQDERELRLVDEGVHHRHKGEAAPPLRGREALPRLGEEAAPPERVLQLHVLQVEPEDRVEDLELVERSRRAEERPHGASHPENAQRREHIVHAQRGAFPERLLQHLALRGRDLLEEGEIDVLCRSTPAARQGSPR